VTLLGEILGVLLGGGALGFYARTRGGRAGGVALAIVAVAALLCLSNGSGLLNAFPSSIAANERLSAAAIENAPVATDGTHVKQRFLDWARDKMTASHRGLRYWIAQPSDSFSEQWFSYALAPGLREESQQDADWLIFYGVKSARVAYDHAMFGPAITYQPGYAIAERVDVR
jgi:hypothetical protein